MDMANPAKLLHSQLAKWNEGGKQGTARALSTNEGWDEQRAAVTNLNNLESAIDEMKKSGKPVDVEEAYFPNWTQAVFAYPNGWNHSGKFIQETTLQFLLQTAHRLADFIPEVTPNAPKEILETVTELEKSLEDRNDIPPALRMLVAESIGFLRNAVLQYDLTGEFILNKAVKKFNDILEILEQTFPAEKSFGSFKHRIHRWYRSTPTQLVLAGVISAQTGYITPGINESIAHSTMEVIEAASQVFELPPAEDSTDNNNSEDTKVIEAEKPDTHIPPEPGQ